MDRKIKTYHIDVILREFCGVYTYTLAGLLPAGVPMHEAHHIAFNVVKSAEYKSPSAQAVGGLAHGRFVPPTGLSGPSICYTSRSGKTYTIEEVNVNGDELQWRFTYPENSHLAHVFAELGSTETLAGVEG